MVDQQMLAPELTERVGRRLTPRAFTVTEANLRHYHEGLELTPPTAAGSLPAVPSTITSTPDSAYVGESGFDNAFGNLWMRQQFEFHAPLALGVDYTVGGSILDVYRKRDRTVVQSELVLTAPGGAEVLRSQHHQSYVLAQSTGEVTLRDPKAKEGARKFDVPAGDRLTPFERTITLEMCGTYFHGSRNYHTDLAASNDLGFRDVVVGGWMTMSYIAHLLERHIGAAWWTGGRLDVKFTNVTWPGDTVIMNAVATGPLAEEPGRDGYFAWIEKPDGTIVLIANASTPR